MSFDVRNVGAKRTSGGDRNGGALHVHAALIVCLDNGGRRLCARVVSPTYSAVYEFFGIGRTAGAWRIALGAVAGIIAASPAQGKRHRPGLCGAGRQDRSCSSARLGAAEDGLAAGLAVSVRRSRRRARGPAGWRAWLAILFNASRSVPLSLPFDQSVKAFCVAVPGMMSVRSPVRWSLSLRKGDRRVLVGRGQLPPRLLLSCCRSAAQCGLALA